jgi:hypothetical protein
VIECISELLPKPTDAKVVAAAGVRRTAVGLRMTVEDRILIGMVIAFRRPPHKGL